MRKLVLLCLGIIAILAVSPAVALSEGGPQARTTAMAQVIGYSVQSDGDGCLYEIDLTTGAATNIGLVGVGFDDVEGLSFDAKGVLYGVNDYPTEQLLTIDLSTGAGTLVGNLNVAVTDVGLTFDPYGNLWMSTDLPGDFYSINPATGAATTIGPQGQMVTGLASSTDGTIYGIGGDYADNLVTINTRTGAATSVGPLVTVSLVDGGIDFDSNGILWGIEDGGTIFTINPLTGQATVVTTTLSGFEGLAIPKPLFQYSFQLNPFVDVVHMNVNPGGWINGINEAPGYSVPVLGKYKGKAYIACDLPAGGIEMYFIVITIKTRDGYMYRIRDDLSLIGPDYVWLTPVTEKSAEGPTLDDAAGSQVTPAAWYDFRLNPWIDIVHLNTDLAPWLWGWQEAISPCYPAPVLGYYRAGRFFIAADFIEGQGGYELAFDAGTIATRDGYAIMTTDGMSYDGPEYFWLTPA